MCDGDLPQDSRSTKDTKFNPDKLSRYFLELRGEHLKSNTLYVDPEFPSSKESWYLSGVDGPVKWKRPKDILREMGDPGDPQFIVGDISRFDINQRNLNDCWFLAALASLTLHRELIHRVVPIDQRFDINYAGIFHFRFWYYGKWVDIVVDDKLPVLGDGLIFNHSFKTNEFWSALLEKAFAKLYGSYKALNGGLPGEAMENLTGGIVNRYLLRELPTLKGRILTPDFNLSDILIKPSESPTIMVGGILKKKKEGTEKGLLDQHAYSITKATTLVNPNAGHVRVRNPDGNHEWKGSWRDSSSEWKTVSQKIKDQINFPINGPKDDGESWMSYNDFKKNFDIIEICRCISSEQWKEIDRQGKWEGETAGGNRHCTETYDKNPHFKLKFTTDLNQQKNLIIILMQKNIREELKKCFKIGFDVYKLDEPNGRRRKLDSKKQDQEDQQDQQFSGIWEEGDEFDLKSGTYSIVVCTEKPNQEAEFVLRILSESGSTVEILEPKEKPGEKSFEKFCDLREKMNSSQLQELLKYKQQTDKLAKPLNLVVEFPENLCQVLVKMFGKGHSGKLNRNEFICLWHDIRQCMKAFEKVTTGLESSPDEDRSIPTPIDVPQLERSFKNLVIDAKKKKIAFADLLIRALRLQTDDVTESSVLTAKEYLS